MDKSKTTSTQTLEEMVIRLVEHFHPQRLILFGSRARGDEKEGSDFDLLIIAPSNEPRWRRTVPAYRLLAGLAVCRRGSSVGFPPTMFHTICQ